jgi:hypothetical protein
LFAYCKRLGCVPYSPVSIELNNISDLDGSAYCLTICSLPFQRLPGGGGGASCTQCRLLHNPVGLVVVANDNRGIK